jgi:hypothetical protein
VVGILLLWMTLFVTTLVPFDFRGDLDRIEVLKSLPLRPSRLALGQILTPMLLVSAVQAVVWCVTLQVMGRLELSLALLAAFTLPFNFVLFAVENVLFLWFPSRLFLATPGDFQALGRNVLFLMMKSLAVTVAVGLAFVVGLCVFLVARLLDPAAEWLAWPAGLAAGWLTLLGCGIALVPLLGLALDHFDVAGDTPA